MLNPAIGKLIKDYSDDNSSRYQLVHDVAARARKISDDAEANHEIIIEKPVSIAINQLAESKGE
jgi:DNA-directed RNA polymerase subunit omega